MRTGTCQHCGNERPILARGLCGTCYGALWRADKLARYPATAKLGRPARKQPTPQTVKWHQIADDRRREIVALRAALAGVVESAEYIISDMRSGDYSFSQSFLSLYEQELSGYDTALEIARAELEAACTTHSTSES